MSLHDLQITYLADHRESIAVLAEWHHREWSHLVPGETLQGRIRRMHDYLGRGCIPTTFVAFDGGELLGSAALVEQDMHGRGDLAPWLASVFVAPQHRGVGVGRRLVARAVEEAALLGVETLHLFTPDRERFYAHMGWRLHERTLYMNEEVVIMTLKPQVAVRTAS